MVGDFTADVLEIDGKVGCGHDVGQQFLDGRLGEGTPEQGDVRPPNVDGAKKRKAHQMVPVGMGEQHGISAALFLQEAISQPSQSGTRVDDEDLIVFGSDFHARGIATVLEIFLA
jgi:hypothetical protein